MLARRDLPPWAFCKGGAGRKGRKDRDRGRARQVAPDAADHAICRRVGGNGRKAWNEIFYDGDFERPIASPAALVGLGLDSSWADALEALRLAPSASNKQPWALARSGGAWQLYLRRNPGYYPALARRIGFADMQLNDMGIAMVHLPLAARERGLAGGWKLADAHRVRCLGLRGPRKRGRCWCWKIRVAKKPLGRKLPACSR